MNFPEFYKVLKHIINKEKLDINITEENFNLFMINRYLSFYHPNICKLINEYSNNYDIHNMYLKPQDGFDFINAIIPKLPYKFIQYVKKPSVSNLRKNDISDEEVENLASVMEMSKREIRNMLQYI